MRSFKRPQAYARELQRSQHRTTTEQLLFLPSIFSCPKCNGNSEASYVQGEREGGVSEFLFNSIVLFKSGFVGWTWTGALSWAAKRGQRGPAGSALVSAKPAGFFPRQIPLHFLTRMCHTLYLPMDGKCCSVDGFKLYVTAIGSTLKKVLKKKKSLHCK